MSRSKAPAKRESLLAAAKRFFATKGYENTSMQDLATEVGVPVGSVYTYFASKQALLTAVIEEGWAEFSNQLTQGLSAYETYETSGDSASAALQKLSFLIEVALPRLFADVDLISILFAEAGRASSLEPKLNQLTELVISIIEAYQKSKGPPQVLDRQAIKTELAILFLGSLEAVRLQAHAGIGVQAQDVLGVLQNVVEATLGCSLPAL
ncbi:MAG TPA: TetR/AcrR family transcriptional regulator [Spirochaetales bacterium]|nr:TetR/AcrR family transcriptional regulator [Spirochaetales bacterium]HPS14604.1 TetR/AcrR family transcriptional regulator [Spirochaetales bacterium]